MSGVMIVTGGGRGIGAAIAREAGRQGFNVAVNYSRARDAAEAVAAEVRAMGPKAAALFAAVDKALGPVTALVNNAGIVRQSAIADIQLADLARLMSVNVFGPVLCAREAVRRMSHSHGGAGGTIVNVSSVSARTGGGPGGVVYAASKGAIDSFTIGLAKEVAQDGIRVCAVRPGITETEIFDDLVGLGAIKDLAREIVPMGRVARPEEIAGLVLWLCSPAASYVTGALYDVTGGR